MRRIALAALAALFILPVSAHAGPPITQGPAEAYHSKANHVACVLLLRYNADGNAVRCGRKGAKSGRLLTWHGRSRKVKWTWPAKHVPEFYLAPAGKTLYLVGGTAKLDGNKSELRCTFTGSDHARCVNGDGHGITITRTTISSF